MNFTSEQLRVIETDSSNFVVVAAAGSGKTSVLTERYLRLVTEGVSPDAILTITFTNKAAADMKRRIVNRLRAERLFNAAQIAETGPIQTFHSFCERILRENSLIAGFDPQFEILSQADAKALRVKCVREVIAGNLDEIPGAERFLHELVGKSEYGSSDPYQLLESLVLEVLSEIDGSLHPESLFTQRFGTYEALRASAEQFINERMDPYYRGTLQGVPPNEWGTKLALAYTEAKKNDKTAPKPLSFIKAKRAGSEKPEDAGAEGAQERSLRHTASLIALALEASWRVRHAMDQQQALDFNALERKAIELLESSEQARRRIQHQFRYVMVDEAQDMSPQQDRLIECLKIQHMMQVGDPQQSIYGFRLADVERFVEKSETGLELTLSTNFRSQPGILNFVNEFFRDQEFSYFRAMQAKATTEAPKSDPDDPFATPDLSFGGVENWHFDAVDLRAIAREIKNLIERGTAPGRITCLVRTGRYAVKLKGALSTVGVPCAIVGGSEEFYARSEVRDLANLLYALADPYDRFSLIASLAGPGCELSVDGLVTVAGQESPFTALESLALELSEDDAKLKEFKHWFKALARGADRRSAADVLGELFAVSPILPNLLKRPSGDQAVANVRKVLSLAAQHPEIGALAFAKQLHSIRLLKEKEGDAPIHEDETVPIEERPVQIMSIHKAKGLEFDTVIVLETHKTYAKAIPNLRFDVRAPMVSFSRDKGKSDILLHAAVAEKLRDRDVAEELRVLYVALTRAKQHLVLVTHQSAAKKDGTTSRLLPTLDRLEDRLPRRVFTTVDPIAETELGTL